MRKHYGLCAGIALTAVTCALFVGCGGKEGQEQANTVTVSPDSLGQEPGGKDQPTPDGTKDQEPGSENQPTPDGTKDQELGSENQPTPDGTKGQEPGSENQPQQDGNQETGGTDMEGVMDTSGVTTVEEDDEERAKTEVIKDAHSGHLMYKGIYYDIISEDSVRIPDYYDLEMTELVIPDAISFEGKTYRVTQIGEDVFSYYYDLEKIVLGNNVEVIEANAFCGCSSLKEVVFGTGLREIGGHAFEGCDMLTEITLPEGLVSIGAEAFCSCEALERIVLPESLLVLGDNMFFDCESLKTVRIPSAVETIPYGLFTNCTSLTEVELFEGLTVIEQEAFWACESLRSIKLPGSLVFLGDRAFYNSGLESVTFPDKRVSAGEGVFDFCDLLETFYVSGDTAGYYEDTFGDSYTYEIVD
ncbi:MAG: leucine-rich repeat protein [Lachnospiraceae bacterium]|nr:leucine-rich repeat protein [Lachnospiraceae bacterium]